MNIKRVGKGVGIFFVLLIGTKVVQVVDGWKAAIFPSKAETTEEVVADKLDKPTPKLTSEELQKFRTLVGDIDTMNDLVTGLAQWNDSQVVYVTVSLEFARLSKLEKGEVGDVLKNKVPIRLEQL